MRMLVCKHITSEVAYYEFSGAYSELSDAPTVGVADGSKYECTDSSNVGKIYSFSEADADWNYTCTLGGE